MPGIHVRSLGRFHWEDQNKESVLTVPGSYWLCHKNNIYKFTFKFHKSIRNSTNFAYSKELMKIIRRVLKWQPKQGQNFSTKNLLVTYNHASWTRQDKTFAVMKFCDRPDAIAFPHAFILTVKILNEEEQSKIEEMGAKAAKPETEKTSMFSLDENLAPSNGLPSENVKEEQENINNIMPTNGQKEKESDDTKDASWPSRTRSRLKDPPDSPTVTNSVLSLPSVQTETTSGDNRNIENTRATTPEETVNGSSNIIMKSSENTSENEFEHEATKGAQLSDHEDECDDSSSDSQSESASLPYQYLIEKDIERSLENSRLAQLANSQKEEESTARSDAFVAANSGIDSMLVNDIGDDDVTGPPKDSRVKLRSRQNSKDSNDSLPPPEVANLKSSNITDLVMKGLMFTIRQDKDTVTVVEQKTKLELDEVLENSEKVETKAGDPCLLNSSLLRLEKMVTRMKEPTRLPEERSNGLNPIVTYVDQCDMEVDPEFSEKIEKKLESKENFTYSNNQLHDHFKNVPGSGSSKLDSYINVESLSCDESEEEDIATVVYSNGNAKISDKKISGNKQLTTEKEPTDQPMDCAISDLEIASSEQLQSAPVVNGISLSKDLTKLPKVISDTIVTNDQLPLELQKVLQNKISGNNHKVTVDIDPVRHEVGCVNNDVSIIAEEMDADDELNLSFEIDVVTVVPDESSAEISAANETSHNDYSNNELDSSTEVLDKMSDPSFDMMDELMDTSVEEINEIEKKSESLSQIMSIKRSQKDIINKVTTEVSSSNSDLADNVRKTRSTSKLYLTSVSSVSNDSGSGLERQIETRSQRMSEKKSNNQLNKILVQQKRKNNTTDKTVSKIHKSDNRNNGLKDVNINMNKLLNDLKYGVEIVVERLDENKIRK